MGFKNADGSSRGPSSPGDHTRSERCQLVESTRFAILCTLTTGSTRSLLGVLLKTRVSTKHHYARKQIDHAIETLVLRSDAFQSVTVIRPSFALCESLDRVANNSDSEASLNAVLDFIEESFARFMQAPYVAFDGVAALFPPGQTVHRLSCVLVTLARQWRYGRDNNLSTKKFKSITDWFFDFILRSALIGENPAALVRLVDGLMPAERSSSPQTYSVLKDAVLRLREDLHCWTTLKVKCDSHESLLGDR
jgi:hypothetical protein